MLRCFELEFRLKVNFNKSNMFGINVQTSFMVATSNFLCCNISDIPFFFKFLGLPIDANPIRMNNLAAYHRLYQKKFGFIEGQILVHRGWVILISLVLSSLPLFISSSSLRLKRRCCTHLLVCKGHFYGVVVTTLTRLCGWVGMKFVRIRVMEILV